MHLQVEDALIKHPWFGSFFFPLENDVEKRGERKEDAHLQEDESLEEFSFSTEGGVWNFEMVGVSLRPCDVKSGKRDLFCICLENSEVCLPKFRLQLNIVDISLKIPMLFLLKNWKNSDFFSVLYLLHGLLIHFGMCGC